MTADARPDTSLPDWPQMTDAQREHWTTVLDTLAAAIPAGATGLVIDGRDAATVADRLADTLRRTGRHCVRLTDANPIADEDTWYIERTPTTVALADGPRWRARPVANAWDLTIWLRADDAEPPQDASATADIVLDLADPTWPVVQRVHSR